MNENRMNENRMNDNRMDEKRTDESRDHTIDALLVQRFRESEATMDARYTRAFAALETADAVEAEPDHNQHARRTRRLPMYIPLARAALIALAFGALFLFFPTNSNASGFLDRVLAVESRAETSRGDRRYDIEVVLPALSRGPENSSRNRGDIPEPLRGPRLIGPRLIGPRLIGTWDLRGDESRLDLTVDGKRTVTRADASNGAWERSEDGVVRPLDERGIWPRWIRDPQGEIAVERMDGLLRLVQRSYLVAFARAGEESPSQLRGALHLVASRQGDVIGPTEIDLWIDTARNVVLEARLTWLPPAPRDNGLREGTRRPSHGPAVGQFDAPPPPIDAYRPSRGMLPPFPPRELYLRRVEPITFPPDHFAMPSTNAG